MTVALAAVGGAVWLVFFSAVLAVADVTVEGVDLLEPAQVRAAASVPAGEPLAQVDLDAVADRVRTLPAVAAVDVSRSWPDGVRILVREREAVAAVQPDTAGGSIRGIDENGVVFRRFAGPPRHLPMVDTAPGTRREALTEAAEVVASLPAGLARRLEQVEVETIDAISLTMRGGKTVFWGSAEASASKAAVLEVLLAQSRPGGDPAPAPEPTVYDVSVPGRPTTRS